MGRDLNSRPPVCKTGILTRLDYPSGKTARQLSGSILIVFGVAIIVANLARGAIIIAAKRTSFRRRWARCIRYIALSKFYVR